MICAAFTSCFKDLDSVLPTLEVRISQVIKNNVVPSNAVEPIYNGIDDIDHVGRRIEDNIDGFVSNELHLFAMKSVKDAKEQSDTNNQS